MRLGSPIPQRKARIEIIPLIDVMFFLLASFMMVSLGMQRVRTMKLDLPSATRAEPGAANRMLEVRVEGNGDIRVGERRLSLPDFMGLVRERMAGDTNRPVYLRPDPGARHGDVLRVLDSARAAGAGRISVALESEGR